MRRERPWGARLAAAWEPDRVKAFLTTQDYGGPDGAYAAAHGLSNDPAVKTAITAALSWLATAGAEDDGTGAELTDEEFADLFGRAGRPAASSRAASEGGSRPSGCVNVTRDKGTAWLDPPPSSTARWNDGGVGVLLSARDPASAATGRPPR